MKKEIKQEDELVTQRILKSELESELGGLTKRLDYKFTLVRREIKRGDDKLREDMHSLEFRINRRFDNIDEVLKKHLDTVRELTDKVIVAHNNFETESVSIHHNYRHLEGRVKKVEEVVFP